MRLSSFGSCHRQRRLGVRQVMGLDVTRRSGLSWTRCRGCCCLVGSGFSDLSWSCGCRWFRIRKIDIVGDFTDQLAAFMFFFSKQHQYCSCESNRIIRINLNLIQSESNPIGFYKLYPIFKSDLNLYKSDQIYPNSISCPTLEIRNKRNI